MATLNAAEPASVLAHRVAFIDVAKASDCDGAPGYWPDGPTASETAFPCDPAANTRVCQRLVPLLAVLLHPLQDLVVRA